MQRLVWLTLFSVLTLSSASAERPNVLFIAIDDLNDWTGKLGGHPQARTPNLDRLADQSVWFRRAYCAAPACNPSRAALLTGIAPHRSGVYFNSQPWRSALPDVVTLPALFKEAGYEVLGAGKIFHGPFPDPDAWHAYFPSPRKTRPADPLPSNRPLNGIPRTAHFDWGPLDVPDEAMGDYKVVEWVCEQLRRGHERPFFLACGLYRPHLPWYVPRPYFDAFPLDKVQLPKVLPTDLDDIPAGGMKLVRRRDHRLILQYKQWHQAVRGYLASVAFADAMVGRVLDALRASPYADNTIVVLWSDHGWHHGQKEHWRKFALWEQTTRVPLMIRVPAGHPLLPGGTPAGKTCDRTVSLLDLYPTLVELCGLPWPKHRLDGRSLLPLLRNPDAPWHRPALTTYGFQNHSIRTERWRYIRYADGSEELYDHSKDPLEWHNLADDEQYRRIKEELAAFLPVKNHPPVPGRKRARRDRINRKQNLRRIPRSENDVVPADGATASQPVRLRARRQG